MNLIDETKTKMKQAIEHLKGDFRNLRTNRVNPHMLDDIKVELYGSEMPLKSVGQVTVQERQLIVTPFDPSSAQAISKAIQQSSLKLNPICEQGAVRVPVPPLNEELRKEIVKLAKQKTESAKVAIREIRRKTNETAKKQKAEGEIAEDELKKIEKLVQQLTDDYCKEIDTLFATKEKEILTV